MFNKEPLISKESATDTLPMLDGVRRKIKELPLLTHVGQVTALTGSRVLVGGLEKILSLGDLVVIETRDGQEIQAEVVGFEKKSTVVMPYHRLKDVGISSAVRFEKTRACIYPYQSWLGRVINAFGEPLDGGGVLSLGPVSYDLMTSPPSAHSRRLVEDRIDLGVRSMNTFTTCCAGQRMGIFAGSGVGKSVLLSMLAKFSKADVIVIGLIGERGREVREFLEKHLGPEGQQRCVTVVATSDESALMRRRAAYMTLSVSEYFRDQGLEVLCLMDSVTRFAMALREIGLAGGEPPTTKGYTPNVFVELPQLLERSGPGSERTLPYQGNITGLFTVLVEGDDTNEPISDTVRGILDGHIILDRKIAERGRFPAINILRSISRTMPDCNSQQETALIHQARNYLSTYDDMEELIRLGAYRAGTNKEVDEAIFYAKHLDSFIAQDKGTAVNFETGFSILETILNTQAAA